MASIDKNRCIAWGEQRSCIVCEEMCPVPDKAIVLEKSDAKTNLSSTLLLPKVIESRCIGCGICEYKCPVDGPAAIKVFTITVSNIMKQG
jgi:formate hydrogenlyase subunit 6/NADH:ubiquinone oxidoreductase subunit I